jgi:uncharacterized protein YndB with AHSA1/START domain
MPDAQYSVTIQAPVETVFAYILDGENCTAWRPGVLDIKRVSGDGAGAIYRQGVKGPMGRRVDADYTVTHAEANRLIEFQTIAGPVRPRGRYEFESVGPATHLTFTLQAELSGLRGLLLGSTVARTMRSEVQTLDRLKDVLEG